MIKPLQYLGQILWYGLFIAFIGYFSSSPSYTHMPPELALIKLAVSQTGQPITPCRIRTEEELAKLPRHMRTKKDCPRERSPVYTELEIDGQLIFKVLAEPSGIAKDGRSSIYQRIPIEAGQHVIKIRMRDHINIKGFNYDDEQHLNLEPREVLVIDFNHETNRFVFH